jgi:hypothetical protein
LYVATTPSLKEFLDSLVFDPFPILFVSVLHIWIGLGFGNSDFGLRVLGFLIGISLIGAIWLSCRLIDKERWAPLWPLAFVALNPQTIVEGDSVRAYGLGLIGIFLSFALIWQLTFRTRGIGTAIAALIAALIAVHSLYLNSLILFAICTAGIVVSIKRKQWSTATVILFVGAIGALSLLPYASIMRGAHEQLGLQHDARSISDAAQAVISTFTSGKPGVASLSILLFLCGLIALFVPWSRRYLLDRVKSSSDELLFAVIVAVVATFISLGFLWSSGLPGSRYRRPLVAALSLSTQVVYTRLRRNTGLTVANLVGFGLTAATFVPSAYHWSQVRRTNCDLAAATVTKHADENDLVIVTRFTHALTFQRYYHGQATWMSVPGVADHRQHRWDLARAAMMNPNSIQDILAPIKHELKAGHKVFLVGKFPRSEPKRPEPIAPADETRPAGKLVAYLDNWHRQIAYLLWKHAVAAERIPLNDTQPVDVRENDEVSAFSGWKD